MELDEQIETAFLAVKNKHISFSALTKNFPLMEVKNYLIEAIDDCANPVEIGDDIMSFHPYTLEFYWKYYKEFVLLYSESNPEFFI